MNIIISNYTEAELIKVINSINYKFNKSDVNLNKEHIEAVDVNIPFSFKIVYCREFRGSLKLPLTCLDCRYYTNSNKELVISYKCRNMGVLKSFAGLIIKSVIFFVICYLLKEPLYLLDDNLYIVIIAYLIFLALIFIPNIFDKKKLINFLIGKVETDQLC